MTANPNNPARKCAKCGATHYRKHYWCAECFRERDGWAGAWHPSKAPPPPPGFNAPPPATL